MSGTWQRFRGWTHDLGRWSRERSDRLWRALEAAMFDRGDAAAREAAAQEAAAEAPVVWLLGRAQAGKSSIASALTGVPIAIGEGFRPVTRTAAVYDFPADAPRIRFLDTRGLGEAGYDPEEDIAWCRARSHLVLAVLRAQDQAPAPLPDLLARIRREQPDTPLVIAQTALHDGYGPDDRHVVPYPFTGTEADDDNPALPLALRRMLARQRSLFVDLPGEAPRFVPIDFTRSEDGLLPSDYGFDALATALIAVADARLAARLAEVRAGAEGSLDRLILWHAGAAAAADAVPVAGLAAVAAVQARMLQALAVRFGVTWTRERLLAFAGTVGTVMLLRQGVLMGLREVVKLVPPVAPWVIPAASLAAFALTYALGRAACVYLRDLAAGRPASEDAIRAAFQMALQEGWTRSGGAARDRS
ncbi:G domain-containing protein [Rhodovastum atsumiense]|uniref:G domain-containing protein n=1 Tax=Rhodovastum atsumiense TaxID=504468 RepID=A0A5M6IXG3_9PROT|nr:GTPase [Rhodovastum atsumiense]KAA5613030.1 hypothetical protein F1189_06620 [Rhodovastum atsumiense]CAH2600115.1 G domain-containing protein [Rhodovastum atsumiense]